MRNRRGLIGAASAGVLLATLALGSHAEAGAGDGLHLALKESRPMADSTVAVAPTEIRLLFTEAPQVGGTSIRLMTPDSTLIPAKKPIADPEDDTVLLTTIDGPIAPGSYLVVWRAMAADGHVVNGDYRFEFRPGDARERR